MKLVTYILKQQGMDSEQIEDAYLLNEAEFNEAVEQWKMADLYKCDRLDALLPPPKRPVSTPLRYAKYDILVDPETRKEYAKSSDGKFCEVTFGSDPQPSKWAEPATEEVVARLISIEDFPKIGKKSFVAPS